MPALLKHGISVESFGDPEELSPKKRRTQVWKEDSHTLRALLATALPDKENLIPGWLDALAAPSVSIHSPEDVKRLDAQDIGCLPVPPLVKSVFRRMLHREAEKEKELREVLEATNARQRIFIAAQRDRQLQPLLFKNGGRSSTYSQDVRSYRLILTREEIEAGVRIVARRLENWCKGERIVLVCILSGAFMFLADLCKALVRPYSVYFVEASSYKDERTASGGVEIAGGFQLSKFVDTSTKAPHKIVLVDELLDNGHTMQEMKRYFLTKLADTHKEKDVLTVCLLSKKRERHCPEADITGIPNLPDLWLVGYGLDDRRTKRGWTELFAMPKVKLVRTVEVEEVEKLLESIDEHAVLKGPLIFNGFELIHAPKQRHRVSSLNVLGAGGARTEAGGARCTEAQMLTKADLQGMLADLPTVKGKYEQELQFAFIQEHVALISEDDIFSGNDRIYAEMRCQLRRRVVAAAQKFAVKGPPPLVSPAS
uniref:Phosphoribosyltransferase domain-containing protein n=1 Tax=Alexandrium monilatum TaxID=311494 RepID=A0A7S4Q3R7_9DINO|mmetsp:Transcript_88174/g.278892  ORF Transcript_88174/g.278892 Transcript_88174/m.278892 type:complete len:483 (-) Transcript_88174:289-1737(-)